ncbi:MAG: PepSY domain-containing protein [Gammaproteobacteria bacterium]|nr:PepSY domain-containing protein [Gammaproteobacteria bacterium]
MPFRTLLVLLAVGLLPAGRAAGDDHARARALVEAGRVLPLAEVLARLPPGLEGRLLDAELEEEHGRPVYELEWLTPDGRVLELELDARDGKLLEREEARD